MFTKNQLSSFSKSVRVLILLALLAAAFLATPASAEGAGPVVTVERLKGIGVGIKIVFPDNISGDLSVFINGVKMNCKAVAPDTLYCVGPLRPNDFGNLSFYDMATQTTIFSTTVAGPAGNDQDETCVPRPAASFRQGAPLFWQELPPGNWRAPSISPD